MLHALQTIGFIAWESSGLENLSPNSIQPSY